MAGVAASGLAAAGVLHLLHRRRRVALQQRPFATRLPTPAPETISHLGRLAAAAPHEDATLDDLTDLLSSIPSACQPALVTVTGAGQVRLLFADDDDPGAPVGPWRLHASNGDQPVGWTATLGATGPRRSVGLPLLVTLGQTAGQAVLANLARLGHLPISGPAHLARRIMQAAALEVATSRTAGPVQVHTTGAAPHEALDQIVRVDDLAGAAAVHLAEREQGVIDEDRTALLLIAATDEEDLPPLATPSDRFLGLLHRCVQPPPDGWLLAIADQDAATLHLPDGGLVTLDLPELDPAIIHQELARLDRPRQTDPHAPPDDDGQDGSVSEPSGEPEDAHAAGSAADGEAAAPHPTVRESTTGGRIAPRHPASANSSAPGHTGDDEAIVEVRILGPVEVFRDGEPLEGLSPLILELLVYLATHRDGVTPERLDDAIWAGQAAKPGSQRLRAALTKLRDTLGPGPDGEPLLPRRRSKSDLVHLAAHVRTDLDAAVHQLEQAHATNGDDRLLHLDRAIALVRGEPFQGWPRSWASEITSRAISQLQDAAAAAAAGHRRRGEHDEAEATIRTGLQLCDPSEILYLEWARLEAARGRRDQIPRILQRLNDAYNSHADDVTGWVATPTRETRQAFAALLEPDDS
ncbi:MAG: hypothetical protein EA340_15350 [Nitriliruptor sp.]|nr:MAG: hypothetical protein EA340_15350 [Nitriliruptor sp.]